MRSPDERSEIRGPQPTSRISLRSCGLRYCGPDIDRLMAEVLLRADAEVRSLGRQC